MRTGLPPRTLTPRKWAATAVKAVMTPHIAVQEIAVLGVLHKDRTLLRQAIQADPLTGAVLMLPQIKKMVDELMEENKEYMKDWK